MRIPWLPDAAVPRFWILLSSVLLFDVMCRFFLYTFHVFPDLDLVPVSTGPTTLWNRL